MRARSLAIFVALAAWGSQAQAAWLTVQTEHVTMSGDLPEADMRALCADLERLDALLIQVTGVKRLPAKPVVIRVFATNAEARARAGIPKLDGGFTNRTPEGPQIIAAPLPGKANGLRLTLFHEYAHAFRLTQLPGPRPLWFEEGFATFFESAEPLADGRMRFGPNANRRAELRHFGVTTAASILALDPASGDGPPPPDFYDTGWLIAHYMFAGGARRKEIEDFVAAFGKGGDVGPLDGYFAGGTAGLDKDLLADANAPAEFEQTVAIAPATAISVRPMSAAEVALTLFTVSLAGAVQVATTADLYAASDRWLDQLDAMAVQYPGDAEIARVAARLALQNGAVDRVVPLIDAALATHPDDASLIALRSIIITTQADRGAVELFDGRIAAARKLVDRATLIAPDNVDVLIARARNLSTADGATPAVAGYLERALAIDPLNGDLRGDLAEIYDHTGDKKKAIATMLPLAESDPNPIIRRRARHTIAALRAGYAFQ